MGVRSFCALIIILGCDPTDPPEPEPPAPLTTTTSAGATPGVLSVDHSGVAHYSVAVAVPPGRNGMEPSLGFEYSSVGADGWLGRGWSVTGGSAITRCARSIVIDGFRGSVRYDQQDAFCLDGSRLVLFAGKEGEDGAEYRTERETFVRVFLRTAPAIDGPARFEVSMPDGTERIYGGTFDSAPQLSTEPVVAQWRLSEVADRSGNSMAFAYTQPVYPPDGPRGALPEVFLESIRYTASDGFGDEPPLPATRRVDFVVETRPDRADGFRYGLAWQRTMRLSAVETYLNDELVRQYRVAYSNDGPSGVSRVTSLRECANAPPNAPSDVDDGLVCLPPTTFEWTLGDESLLYQTELEFWSNVVDVGYSTRPGFNLVREFTPVIPADVDGDGTDDLAYLDDATLKVRFGNGSGGVPLSTPSEVETSITGVDATFAINGEYFRTDHNQDGRDDLALVRETGAFEGTLEVWMSTGDDFVRTATNLQYSAATAGLVTNPATGLPQYPELVDGSPTAYAPASFTYLFDVNGDGLDDAVSCEVFRGQDCFRLANQGPNSRFWLDACPGTFTAAFGVEPGVFSEPVDTGVEAYCRLNRSGRLRTEIGDFTGDGIADVLFASSERPPAGDPRRFIVGGTYSILSFDAVTGAFRELDTGIDHVVYEYPQRLDVNGDGLQDLVTWSSAEPRDYYEGVQTPQQRSVFLATGDGEFQDPIDAVDDAWEERNRSIRYRFSHCKARRCRLEENRFYYWIPQPDLGIDLNGDGRGDLLAATLSSDELEPFRFRVAPRARAWTWATQSLTALVSDGTTFGVEALSDTVRSSQFARTSIPGPGGPSDAILPITDFHVQSMDADGDGTLDLVRYTLPTTINPGTVAGGDLDILLNRRARRERVSAVANGLGARHEIEYAPLSNPEVYTPSHDCAWPQTCTADSRWVVREVRWDNGAAEARRETYKYWGARTDLLGRGWLGFEKRSVSDHSTNEVRTYHYDNQTRDASVGAYYLAHTPSRITTVVQDEQPSTDFSLPSSTMLGSWRELTRRIRLRGHLWSVVVTDEETRYFEETGAVVDGEADEPFAALSTRHATTQRLRYHPSFDLDEFHEIIYEDGTRSVLERTYVEPTEHWQLGLVRTSRTMDEDKCGRDLVMRFTYDERGRVDRMERQPDGLAPPRTPEDRLDQVREITFAYDGYGNRVGTTESDLRGNVRSTSVEMDGETIFPSSFTNAVGQTSEMEYFARFGTLYHVTDPNDAEEWTVRDGFGRVRQRVREASHDSEITYAGGGASRTFRVRETHTTGFSVSTFFDAIGRLTDQSHSAPGDRFAFRRVRYDEAGRVVELSEPFFSGDAVYSTRREFDGVGTLRRETAPSGAVRHYGRSPDERAMLDPEGHRYELRLDARGRTAESREPGELGGTQHFEYCIDGRPKSSRDAFENITEYLYDPLGRRLAVNDPDAGIRGTNYDAFDRLRLEKDARGQVVSFGWDPVDRLVERTDDTGASTWEYDVGPGALGRLVRSTSPDGISTELEWDELGRLASSTRFVDGDEFRYDQTYDDEGRPETLTYPGIASRPSIQYRYDVGFLAGIDDGSGGLLWQQDDVDAIGNLTRERFGNNALTIREHQPGTRRVTRIDTNATVIRGGVPTIVRIQARSFEHDDNGNPTLRRDELHGLVEDLEYDPTQRLRFARSVVADGPTENLEYRYDQLGNMIWASDVGSIDHSGARPHAASSFLGEPQLYDANGNHLGDSVRRDVQYNSFDKPTVIKDLVRDTQLFVRYDAEQSRAVTDGSGGRHVYFGDFEQRDALEVAHVVAHGRRVAQIRTDVNSGSRDVRYLHGDDLGSVEASTDASGEVVARHAYSPFGRRFERDWTFDDDAELGFTEHEHDDEVGLINMRGRMYDPEMRRFTSPDPFVPVAHSPQAHNRYSYVFNRPATFTDPSGYQPVPLPSPWVPYPLDDAEELQDESEEPSTDDGPSGEGSGPETAAGLGTPPPSTPSPTASPITEITLVIVSNDRSPLNPVDFPNATQNDAWRFHARQIRPGATVEDFTSVRDATEYIRGLPAGTRIRNLVALGHGFGEASHGSGAFAVQSLISGGLRPSPSDLLGVPGSSADSTAFWEALADRLVGQGQVRVQFLACYIGRDPAFAQELQQRLTNLARQNQSAATVGVDAFRDYYAVHVTGVPGEIQETASLEVPRAPITVPEQDTLQRNAIPASTGQHAQPSVSYP